MLAIRMQRTGRKGYPTYRVVVQEAHRQPTSGRVVANLGSYNPHTKENSLDKEKVAVFLQNGAQPSDRVVKLLVAEKVTLPAWVNVPAADKQKSLKNAEKLRRNQPKEEPVAEAPQEAPAEADVTTTEADVTATTPEEAPEKKEEASA